MESLAERVVEWLEPKLVELNAFLVSVRQNQAQHRIEVFLDRDSGHPGIDIETCAEVSRYLQFHLDQTEGIPKQYTLEVSSPGMDNPFKVFRQYQKYRGSRVEVLLNDGRKLDGILVDTDEKGISLDKFLPPPIPVSPAKKKLVPPQTERVRIDFNEIKTTKRKFEF